MRVAPATAEAVRDDLGMDFLVLACAVEHRWSNEKRGWVQQLAVTNRGPSVAHDAIVCARLPLWYLRPDPPPRTPFVVAERRHCHGWQRAGHRGARYATGHPSLGGARRGR